MRQFYATVTLASILAWHATDAQNLVTGSTSSHHTFIYKISNDEARHLYQRVWKFDTTLIREPYDRYRSDSGYHKTLPVGHYLFVRAVHGRLRVDLRSVNPVNLKILNNHRDLVLLLLDSAGQSRDDFSITISGKAVYYDKELCAYRLPRSNKRGLVIARSGTHESIFELNRRYNNRLPLRIARTVLRTFPLNHVVSPYYYVRNTVRNVAYGGRVNPPGIYYRFASIFRPKPAAGYIAFNKPMFKPGDTVHMKGYVASRKGRPMKRAADLFLTGPTVSGNIEKKLARLKPTRNGVYLYELALCDSLMLLIDRTYSVELRRRQKHTLLESSFRLEDYQLKVNTFALRSEQPDPRHAPILYLKGEDSNGLPLFDAQATVSLRPKNVTSFYNAMTFIPDSIWKTTVTLEPIGETRVVIPDGILPDAMFNYEVIATFFNSSQERTTKTLTLQYDSRPFPAQVELKGDSMLVKSLGGGEQNSTLTLRRVSATGEESETIFLPYREKINPSVGSYLLSTQQQGVTKNYRFEVRSENDLLEVLSHRTFDSMFVQVQNPRQLPFWYYLFRNNHLLEKGYGTTLELHKRTRSKDSYSLSVQYLWGGETKTVDYQLYFDERKLDIRVVHPERVYPGEKASFSIEVRDTQGRPVENVDLTALATTQQFLASPPAVPSFVKRFRGRVTFNEFSSTDQVHTIDRPLKWSFFRQRLGLDSMAFYQFLFPENGYYEFRLPAESSQVAPYVVSHGDTDPVGVIYIDNRPVYFAGSTDQPPYSLKIDTGFHSIRLRLPNGEVTLPRVHLNPYEKLILSIDKNHLPANASFRAMTGALTEPESKQLNRYFIYLPEGNPMPAYMSQGSDYHLVTDRKAHLVGPVYPGDLSYTPHVGRSYRFPFEPGFSYEFKSDIIRQRPADMNKLLRSYWRMSNGQTRFSDSPLTFDRISSYWKALDDELPEYFSRLSDFTVDVRDQGVFTAQVSTAPHHAKVVANILFDLDKPENLMIYPYAHGEVRLAASRYQAVFLLADGSYIRVDSIDTKARGRNHLEVNNYQLHAPDSFSGALRQLIRHSGKSRSQVFEERMKEVQQVRKLYYEESVARYGFSHLVKGCVTDEYGDPIPGVNVVVKGTTAGTVTDQYGFYYLNVPPHATLVISFIGLNTEEVEVEGRAVVNVPMISDVKQLNEVVVTAMGVSRMTHNLSASVATLQGRVPGIAIGKPGSMDALTIRGVSSISENDSPLIILDGVPVVPGSFNAELVTYVEVLKGEQALALYGARAKGGVIIMSTQPGMTKEKLMALMPLPMHSLPLADSGRGSTLRKNFRDFAFWQPNLVTDQHGRAQWEATFPDDITAWSVTVLAMARKKTGQASSTVRSFKPLLAQISLPSFLIEGDSALGAGKVTNYTRTALHIGRSTRVSKQVDRFDSLQVVDSHLDTLLLRPTSTDSLDVEYTLQTGAYRDGERRKVPVLPQGVRESVGMFTALPRDTTFSLSVRDEGSYHIYAQADLLDVFEDEVDWLIRYPYNCNEQLASRLIALLTKKKITQLRKEKFDHFKQLNKVMQQLAERQNKDGGWGWWPGGTSEDWITLHVARVFSLAFQQGMETPHEKEALMHYLVGSAAKAGGPQQLQVLVYLAEQGEKISADRTIEEVMKAPKLSLYTKLLVQRLRQVTGHEPDWAWINSHRQVTSKNNSYWGEDQMNIFENSIGATLTVYRMLAQRKGNERQLDAIRSYFLERRTSHWRNTYESSEIIQTLAPEALERSAAWEKPMLYLTGAASDTVTTFPYSATAKTGTIQVAKKGSGTVYFTLFREHWVSNPAPVDSNFSVHTYFSGNTHQLQRGKPVTLTVAVEVKKDAEFVMIEVPIPAGCSYEEKKRQYGSGEVHREHYAHKTNIYCQDLRKGHYEYQIELLPRYSGKYRLNPALAECMYFPVLYGREGLKHVSID